MIRVIVRVVVALVLALAALIPAASAMGSTPSPTPTVNSADYAGSATGSAGSQQFSYTTTAHVDCATQPCLLTIAIGREGGAAQVGPAQALDQGTDGGSWQEPGYGGDPCADDSEYVAAGLLTVRLTATTLSYTRTTTAQEFSCGAGNSAAYPAYTVSGTLTLTAGAGCLAMGDCPTPTPSAAPLASRSSSSSRSAPAQTVSGTRFSDPGTLSTLPTAAEALTPRNALWATAAAVVLVLLISLPTHLLNTATEKLSDRIEAWRKRIRRRPKKEAEESGRPVRLAGWPAAAAGVLAASVISAFVDPSFGFNGGSLRTFLSILVSFLLDAVVGWFLLILLVRRTHPSATASFHFSPASLLVVAVAVLFTRLTGFQPGIVFGLVAGVAFGAVLATADKARVALIGLGYSFGVGVVGWIGYSVLTGLAGSHPAGGVVFAQETLSSMAIGGIAALPIALVPLRGLVGGEVFAWNRWIWAGAYAIGLAGFFLVLMPMPFSWQSVPLSLWVWIGIFIAYALAALVIWLLAARPWKREPEPADAAATSG